MAIERLNRAWLDKTEIIKFNLKRDFL
jgi:hypothetical protein